MIASLPMSSRRQGQLRSMKTLWTNVLTIPLPSDQQFMFWVCSFGCSIVSQGILDAAKRNLRLGGTMDQSHAVKFASCVMNKTSRVRAKQRLLTAVTVTG